jgi:16S rRNA (cytosine1402-N4)-methyltransferase
MEKYIKYLKTGGKIIIISFHSLEDRIVKHCFKASSKNGELSILTKKPIMSSKIEQVSNSRSKSAKLRCAVKI